MREATAEFGQRYLVGRDGGDGADARRHRPHVPGDAGALTFPARPARGQSGICPPSIGVALEPRAAAHHPADTELRVELHEIGSLADRDPATVGDA